MIMKRGLLSFLSNLCFSGKELIFAVAITTFCTDYYQHIRRKIVVPCLERQASSEKDSKNVSAYLDLIQNTYPHDAKGNQWIGSQFCERLKATIERRQIYHVQGLWWKVALPECWLSFPNTSLAPISVNERVVCIKSQTALHANASDQIEVIVEEQSAYIQPNGTTSLPNGRMVNVHVREQAFVNTLYIATPILATLQYDPFAPKKAPSQPSIAVFDC